jgi:hypothetical protein
MLGCGSGDGRCRTCVWRGPQGLRGLLSYQSVVKRTVVTFHGQCDAPVAVVAQSASDVNRGWRVGLWYGYAWLSVRLLRSLV